jgi:hypothetical protein
MITLCSCSALRLEARVFPQHCRNRRCFSLQLSEFSVHHFRAGGRDAHSILISAHLFSPVATRRVGLVTRRVATWLTQIFIA